MDTDITNIDEVARRAQRRCERIEDRIDIAASAYRWSAGVSAYPWYRGLSREERRVIRDRVFELGRVANGHGLVEVRDASDEAALAVFRALPLDGPR